ncbi:hypothetical protein WIS52_03855 [Pseudonocardia nematodicida]|uniref:Uncharacterized protein n=1 Tax=Pseudonocardia nematodicida TaxID=1206997 RepID=A0ABV1K6Y1_9PSEU
MSGLLLTIRWLPGDDRLEATCHCGAVAVLDGPEEAWSWLRGHPRDHRTHEAAASPRATRPEPSGVAG